MEKKKVSQISAKLNPEFDMELIDKIGKIPKRERSHMYREAVKRYLETYESGNKSEDNH